ncbi:hypothetical protein QE152_g12414 [Popillia japonica]|uniref:Fibronectin type-III domain-containing protein n=1 Tax=Popillia japonica TaxID=7064 RepID=A0AAW1LKU1_POPJA
MNRLIREKRTKVLVFVILLFAVNGVYSAVNSKFPNLLHLATNNGNEEVCVAFDEDAYSAVEWYYPIPEDETQLPKTDASYLPLPSTEYGCNFEEGRQCNKIWDLKNWTISIFTANNYIPIFDTRWDGFKIYVITNKTKINDNGFVIPEDANIGLSIRSAGSVDILLCKGFDPKSYPCYTITLGGNNHTEISIKKQGVKEKLSTYSNDFPILAEHEWKNFGLLVSKTGQIHLNEANTGNSYINVTDPKPFETLFLFMNSTSPSLWKIHKNQFLYTNTSQVVPFGPLLNVSSSTLCLSMYLMMCRNCSFYIYKDIDNDKEIVFEEHGANNSTLPTEWKHVKIIVENFTENAVQLYVKTKSNATDRFWAIDDVRTCHKNEFKINRLTKSDFAKTIDFVKAPYSCHTLNFPEWRPKRKLLPPPGLPMVFNVPSTTSITSHWTPLSQPYILKYEGSDLCSKDTTPRLSNQERLKSNGWVIIKPNEDILVIDKLIPFTSYAVKFIDPIYKMNKTYTVSTLPTDKPKMTEIPKFTIQPSSTEVSVSIPARLCNVSFGPLIYGIEIIGQIRRQIEIEHRNIKFENLEPFTNYTLSVQAARTNKKLNDSTARITTYYNFTTEPAVAAQMEFVELYEIGQTFASFRYKLPKQPRGKPISVQIMACATYVKECPPKVTTITQCKLWKDFYCVTIDNLVKQLYYTFKLSIRNNNTNSFGGEKVIIKQTVDQEPGIPTNLSYTVINCSNISETCNLNISWTHPYNQTGVIKLFEIFLLDSEPSFMEKAFIESRNYLSTYSYLIPFVPYAASYNLSIRACNDVHKGKFASISVKIDHIGQHINQTPEVIRTTDKSVTFQLPKSDYRLNSSTVTIIVQQDDNKVLNISPNLTLQTEDSLCLHKGTSWIAGEWQVTYKNNLGLMILYVCIKELVGLQANGRCCEQKQQI